MTATINDSTAPAACLCAENAMPVLCHILRRRSVVKGMGHIGGAKKPVQVACKKARELVSPSFWAVRSGCAKVA